MSATQPRLAAAVASEVGPVRDHNEDAALVEPGVFVVADGMGGHLAGEVASEIAVRTLAELAGRGRPSPQEVLDQVAAANRAILDSAEQHPEQSGMGTTLAALVLVDGPGSGRWLVANVGDSRVYHHVDGELRQLTADHSEVAELVRMGVITEQEAGWHPARNIVTRSLGRAHLDPVDHWLLPVREGERFLLCTDGLTNELEPAEIASVVGAGTDPQDIADSLVSRAVAHGGRDNVTVVVVLVGSA